MGRLQSPRNSITTPQKHGAEGIPTYQALISDIATYCHGMSGASLAGVARAAASHALERIVGEYSKSVVDNESPPDSMMDCVVTRKDFDDAIHDVYESAGDRDWEPTKDELPETADKSASEKE
jgi:SpoVK/Ycf46/Vps4 family AAA+-type ATPase